MSGSIRGVWIVYLNDMSPIMKGIYECADDAVEAFGADGCYCIKFACFGELEL